MGFHLNQNTDSLLDQKLIVNQQKRSRIFKSFDSRSRSSLSKDIPFVYESTLASVKIQRINELMNQSNIHNEDLPISLQAKKRISSKIRITFPTKNQQEKVELINNKKSKGKFKRDK